MKRKIVAAALALALTLSLGAGAALADEQQPLEDTGAAAAGSESADGSAAGEGQEDSSGQETPAEEEAPSLAGPDAQMEEEEGDHAPAYTPDPVGQISFANLERRLRESNLNVLALEENILALESIDYESQKEKAGDLMSSLAELVWLDPGNMELQKSYQAAADAYDALRKGELQKDNEGVIWQLNNAQDQIVLLGESLYIGILKMETQEAALQRQLAALNRTVEEMELRYQLGQVSALQLEQAKAGRTSLISGLETLQMNIHTYKIQLESMIGAEMKGEIQLGAAPSVAGKQLDTMDLEADLKTAKEKSYELYDADETLDDAIDDYVKNVTTATEKTCKHQATAARITHSAAYQNYELKFRGLFDQVQDCRQILSAAQVSLASEEAAYAAAALKYEQGTISKNKLLEAEDALDTAREQVETASVDLFSAYNTYCWAVQHGIINN